MKKIHIFCGLITLFIIGYFIFVQEPTNIDSNLTPIRIGYNTESVANVAIIIAYEKGYFQKHGISPKMIPLKSGREVMQALAADQVDLGTGSVINFLQAMVKKAPIRIIAPTISSSDSIFVRPDENLNMFTDLYGKIVSVSPGGVGDLSFRLAMKKESVDINRMNLGDVERGYEIVALMTKKAIDAVVASNQDAKVFIKAGAIVLPEWKTKGYDSRPLPRNSIATNINFLNKNESAVESFLDAIADAHRLIDIDPMEASGILAKHIKAGSDGAVVLVPEEIVAQWKDKEIINMIWQNPDTTMELVKKAKEIGSIDKNLAVEDVFDLRFENKLKATQREIYGE